MNVYRLTYLNLSTRRFEYKNVCININNNVVEKFSLSYIYNINRNYLYLSTSVIEKFEIYSSLNRELK